MSGRRARAIRRAARAAGIPGQTRPVKRYRRDLLTAYAPAVARGPRVPGTFTLARGGAPA